MLHRSMIPLRSGFLLWLARGLYLICCLPLLVFDYDHQLLRTNLWTAVSTVRQVICVMRQLYTPEVQLSPQAGARGKRRRPVKAKASDDNDTGLPPPLALSMLSHLLGGGNGHAATVAARDTVMADDGAAGGLEVWMEIVGRGDWGG